MDIANKVIESLRKLDPISRKGYIFQSLSGDSNRYLRQQIMQILTGKKLPLVKCGVTMIEEKINE